MNQRNALLRVRQELRCLPLVAQGLALDTGVRVVFDPNCLNIGQVDLQTMTITLGALPVPSSPSDAATAEKMLDYAYGLIHHEIGHVRHTDRDAWNAFGRNSPLHLGLMNAIEDPREERQHIDDYPGAEGRLNRLVIHSVNDGGFPVLTDQDSPGQLVQQYVLYLVRQHLRPMPELEPLVEQSRPALVTVFGEAFVTRLETLCLLDADAMTSTADAVALAKAILVAMEEEAKPPADPNASQDPSQGSDGAGDDDGDDGAPSNGAGDSDSDASAGGNAPNAPNAPSADGSSSSGPDDGTTGANGAGSGSTSPPAAGSQTTATQRAAIEQALSEQVTHAKDLVDAVRPNLQDAIEQVAKRADDVIDTRSVPTGDLNDRRDALQAGNADVDLDAAMAETGRLRQRLAVEIQGLKRSHSQPTKRGTRFNHRALHRLATGDNRIFLRVKEQKALDTAVMILVDVSGSMSGPKVKLASEALFATAVAMDSLTGVKTAAMTFPGNATVLGFDQRAANNRDRFTLRSYGSTPLYEALILGYRELRRRRESRKLMLVITDGQPDRLEASRETIAELERRYGIEMLGLGIQDRSVENLFRTHRTIQDVTELAPAMIEMLRDELRRQLAA